MKKALGSLIFILFISTGWLSAQCTLMFSSPNPKCIRTLPDGTIEVDYDLSTTGGAAPADFAAIRLERSSDGQPPWSTIQTVPIGGAWPTPQTMTDATADGNNFTYVYRFVATCFGPPATDLAPSALIKNVLLTSSIANDFEVSLTWNWDTLSANLTTTLNRKFPATGSWSAIANPTYVQGAMGFTDTVITCNDSLRYRVVLNNNAKVCQNISNEIGPRVIDQTPPNVPKIDTISFDNKTNKPLITWNVNPQTDTKGYVVLFFPSSDCGTGRVVDTVLGRLNTKLIDNLWYDGQTAGQYAVYAFDECVPGPFSISQRSNCASSIQLNAEVDVCEKTVDLTWTPYNFFASGTDVLYQVFVSTDGAAFISVGTSTTTNLTHENPIESAVLRYKVVAYENGGAGPKTTSSNRVVLESEFLQAPDFNYLRYVTVEDENYTRLQLFTNTKHDVDTYVLKRAKDSTDVFNTVNVFYAPQPKLPVDSLTLLSDHSPITDQYQYYYKVDMYDSCGSYLATSNFVSTMMLKVQVDNVRRVNRLEWTNVWGWEGKTFAYKIYRYLDGQLLKQPLTVFPDSAVTTVYYDSLLLINDNITLGNPSEGNYCYVVEAIEDEPTFMGIPPSKALSNEVCVVQQPYISNPNAFTPNGDGLNESFKPVVIYHDLSAYEFYIMNRFGDVIYETTNVKASWDGTTDGKPVPQGVYVYSVKYKSSTGQEFEDKGTISVVR